jgi:hypothetical protein
MSEKYQIPDETSYSRRCVKFILASGNPGIEHQLALSRKALLDVSSLFDTNTKRHDPLKQKYIKNKLSQCRAACVI